MKKTLLYVLLLGVLVAGLYIVFGKKQEGFADKDSNFSIKDTASIGKVFLVARNGDSILLERDKDGWILNKNYRSLQSTVTSLFSTFYQQVGKHPVPEKSYNNVIKALAVNSVKVEVYDRNNNKMREFYVGGETKNFDGSYMMMAGSEVPFIVEIPGFPGYLSSRYTTEFLDWRDRSIFLIGRENISRVSVQYPAAPLNSFVVNQDKNGKITVDVNPGIAANNELNVRRAELFLTFFEKVYAEGFTSGTEGIKEVLDTISKRAIIDVTTVDGKARHLDIFWMPKNRRSKNMLRTSENIPDVYDADRGYGVINDGKDTVMVQYQAFDKIFRNAYEFYEKDREPAAVQK